MSHGQWLWVGFCAFLGALVAFFAGLEPVRVGMDAVAGALAGLMSIGVHDIWVNRAAAQRPPFPRTPLSSGQWQWIGFCAFLGAFVAVFGGLAAGGGVVSTAVGGLIGWFSVELYEKFEHG